MKVCKNCKISKSESDFGKDARVKKDGLQAICKLCKNKKSAQWRILNKEKQNLSVSNWRKKNPDKVSLYSEKYKESKRRTNKTWHLNNKEKNLAYGRARRAKIRGSEHSLVTDSDVISKYGNNCYLCYEKIDLDAPRKIGVAGWEWGLHIEHVIPVSKNGSGKIENLRPSHGICNLKKGASEIDYISR